MDNSFVASSFDRPASRAEQEREIDLRRLLGAVRRRKGWVIVPTLLAAGVAYAGLSLVTPRFTGETRLLLENRDSFYTRPERADREGSSASLIDAEAVQSQVQVITSNDLAREAVRRLSLSGNPEFDPAIGGFNPLRQLLALAGVESPTDRSIEERVVDSFRKSLLVFPVGKSRVVAVEFTSIDAELAARAANTVAELYLDDLTRAKSDTARTAGNWLSGSIDDLRRRVTEAEAKVETFRSGAGLQLAANNNTVAQQQLAEFATQLTVSRSQQAEAQAKARLLREAIRSRRGDDVSDIANNELVRRLNEQRITLRAQLANESRTLLPGHPTIKSMQAQAADIDSQIRAMAERTVRAFENDARLAGARLETLEATVADQKRRSADANEAEVQLRALEREAKTLREQLESYLGKYREAAARNGGDAAPADARVISHAVAPSKPSFPKVLPTTLIAALGVLALSNILVVSRELVSPQDPDADDGRTLDESVPATAFEAERTVTPGETAAARLLALPPPSAEPGTPAALAAALTDRLRREGRLRVVVAPLGAGQHGAALALGRKLAEQGRVILIPLASGEAGRQALRGQVTKTLGDLLEGNASFADAIGRDRASSLHVLPPGRLSPETLSLKREVVSLALDALAEAYDAVIVEVPATDAAALLPAFAANANAVLLAVSATPDQSAATRAGDELRRLTGLEASILVHDEIVEQHEQTQAAA